MSQGMLVAGVRLHRERPIMARLEKWLAALAMDFIGDLLFTLKGYGWRGLSVIVRREWKYDALRSWPSLIASDGQRAAGLILVHLLGLRGMYWMISSMIDDISKHRPDVLQINDGLCDAHMALHRLFHPVMWAAYDALLTEAQAAKAARKAELLAEVDTRIDAMRAEMPSFVKAAYTTIFNWNDAYHERQREQRAGNGA